MTAPPAPPPQGPRTRMGPKGGGGGGGGGPGHEGVRGGPGGGDARARWKWMRRLSRLWQKQAPCQPRTRTVSTSTTPRSIPSVRLQAARYAVQSHAV
jgi:hypothetical protein